MIKQTLNKFGRLFIYFGITLSLLACSPTLSGEPKNKCDKEFENLDLVQYSFDTADDRLASYLLEKPESYTSQCRALLRNSELAKKLYSLFEVFSKDTYQFFVCQDGKVLEVFAQPMFVLGHYVKNIDHCMLDGNPFGRRKYYLSFEVKSPDFSDIELVSMLRGVE